MSLNQAWTIWWIAVQLLELLRKSFGGSYIGCNRLNLLFVINSISVKYSTLVFSFLIYYSVSIALGSRIGFSMTNCTIINCLVSFDDLPSLCLLMFTYSFSRTRLKIVLQTWLFSCEIPWSYFLSLFCRLRGLKWAKLRDHKAFSLDYQFVLLWIHVIVQLIIGLILLSSLVNSLSKWSWIWSQLCFFWRVFSCQINPLICIC